MTLPSEFKELVELMGELMTRHSIDTVLKAMDEAYAYKASEHEGGGDAFELIIDSIAVLRISKIEIRRLKNEYFIKQAAKRKLEKQRKEDDGPEEDKLGDLGDDDGDEK